METNLPDTQHDKPPEERSFVWRRPWARWALILGVWTLLGLLFSSQFYLAFQRAEEPLPWRWAFSLEMIYAYLWAALTPLVFWLARRFRIERQHLGRNILIHLLMSILIGFSMRACHDVIFYFYIMKRPGPLDLGRLIKSAFFLFDYGILTYWVILLIQSTLDYNHRFREGMLKASRLEAQLAHSQLQALKMQLQPHFLFNTLNSISALLHKDVEAADRMIARLGRLLRLSLDNSRAQLVTLQHELDFLQCYLDIEEIRFQERLRVERNIEADALSALVPNLLLQPIVENAIKHGISSLTEKGFIKITARCNEERLHIIVEDNGPGLAPDESSGIVVKQGFGLSNTRSRLTQLYGEDFSFELENAPDGGLVVTFDLPLRYDSEKNVA